MTLHFLRSFLIFYYRISRVRMHRTCRKSCWELPLQQRDISIIGDSNLEMLDQVQLPFLAINCQLDCYPGLKIHHVNNMLTKYTYITRAPVMLLLVGVNNRATQRTHLQKEIRTMAKILKHKWTNTKVTQIAKVHYLMHD